MERSPSTCLNYIGFIKTTQLYLTCFIVRRRLKKGNYVVNEAKNMEQEQARIARIPEYRMKKDLESGK